MEEKRQRASPAQPMPPVAVEPQRTCCKEWFLLTPVGSQVNEGTWGNEEGADQKMMQGGPQAKGGKGDSKG